MSKIYGNQLYNPLGPLMSEEDRYTRITLRIPKEIHQQLAKSASERSHSMNAEIVQRLEDSFEPSSIPEIISQHVPYRDAGHAIVNLVLACDSLEHAEEIYKETLSDKAASELDKALSRHEVSKARKHLNVLANKAAKELPIEDRKRLPDYVLKLLDWNIAD
ncbi:Arc family DNA-binding protein [Acetobacter fabarum]|mgnify:CR=1 FL=1|uniref:Arc family DNA-binding protein n=1 Tax=Acetobacter fabarum TaxID=483199 RepID=UPI0039EA4BEB